jgi:hypothetical protein
LSGAGQIASAFFGQHIDDLDAEIVGNGLLDIVDGDLAALCYQNIMALRGFG